ncbi:MAG: beta-ketoacyl synthase N-terminal-like domain-containing protein, partial [Cyclobacteriaceae bacterium]
SYVSEVDKAVIGEAFRDLAFIENENRKQIEFTARLSEQLTKNKVPVITPATAHCLLLRVDQIKGYSSKYGKEAYLKKVLEQTGIRGGMHSPGQQTDTILNECVRFCVPIGLSEVQIAQTADLLATMQPDQPITESTLVSVQSKPAGQIPVAIVGLSVSFPQSPNKDVLWENLEKGKDCTGSFPAERLSDPERSHLHNAFVRGGFIEEADKFDSLFFGISPKEARLMDPQQRLILEKSWEAVEDAGYTRNDLSRKQAGVFLGIPNSDYRLNDTSEESAGTTGLATSIASSRVSYVFNLKGPSEVYNTNCSSSFVALHRAIQSIQLGECSEAIVGGVQVISSLQSMKTVEALGVLSPSGSSKSFDHSADGYVRSEGVGAMLVKPLDQAKADGDHIYAVVKGTAVGHGGTGLSLSAPNAKGMMDVVKKAYQQAGISSDTIQYIEAHGISSPTPDAIELDALKTAFVESSVNGELSSVCKIGAIKPSIGHAEYASGMAIITKVIMAMKNKLMPGIPFLEKLNNEISVGDKPFVINNQNQYWSSNKDETGKMLPRRASLNSYGTGGVNAHIVLEEYIPERKNPATPNLANLFVLSADNEDVLKVYAENMLAYLKEDKVGLLIDHMAYTLLTGREARNVRLAMIAESENDLVKLFEAFLKGHNDENLITGDIENLDHESAMLTDDKKITQVLSDRKFNREGLTFLAEAWINDLDPDWHLMYEGKNMQKLSLPTYPFDKQRYWVAAKSVDSAKSDQTTASKGIPERNLPVSEHTSVKSFMVDYLSKELELDQSVLKGDKKMIDFGVDSIVGQKLGKELLERFHLKVTGRNMLDYQTIDDLSAFLSARLTITTDASVQESEETDADLIALEKFKNGELSLEEIEKLM